MSNPVSGGKNKKNIPKCHLLNLLPRVLNVNDHGVKFDCLVGVDMLYIIIYLHNKIIMT